MTFLKKILYNQSVFSGLMFIFATTFWIHPCMKKNKMPKYIQEERDASKSLTSRDIFHKAKWLEAISDKERQYIYNLVLNASNEPYDGEVDTGINAFIILNPPTDSNLQILAKFMDKNAAFGLYKDVVESGIRCWSLWNESEKVQKWLANYQ